MKHVLAALMLTAAATGALATDPQVINDKAFFPEGPVLVDGKLFYAEYAGHTVTVWDGKTNTPIWKQEGCGPAGVVPLATGFGIACYDAGQIVIISSDGKTLKTYDKDSAGNALAGPNDGAPDGTGGAWFTLSGPWEAGPIVGRVVHLAADGTLTPVADDLHYANGIVLGADGRLYVNESEAGRTISFAVAKDGTLSDRRVFARYYRLGEPADVYPDGIKLGPNGNFFVGEYSAGVVLEVAPDGTLKAKHEIKATTTPNMTFSADGKTMYVMAVDNVAGAPYEGRVLAVPLP